MNTELEKPKHPWRKRLAVAVAILVIIAGIACIFDALAVHELGRAMNEARAMGGPVTMAELMATRKHWPDDKNGAQVILAVENKLKALSQNEKASKLPIWGDRKETPAFGHRWPDNVGRDVHDFLDSLQPELATIDTLKNYEGGAFDIKLDPNPTMTLLPHLGPLRGACRLKRLQAIDRAMHGDSTHLVDDVTVMMRASDLVYDEPVLISMLVRVAISSLAIHSIEDTCGLTTVAPDDLRKLQDIVAKLDEGDRRIVLGLRGERACFIGIADYARRAGLSLAFANMGVSTQPDVLARLPGARGILIRDEANGIRRYNRLIAAAEQSRALSETRAIERDIDKLGPWAVFTRILFPSFPRAIILDTRLNVEARCAQVGLAAERFRIDTGRFPARLDELVPKYIERIPADPFVPTQPLKLATLADRIIIYSVNDDEIDNGGDVSRDVKNNNGNESSDWGFILLAPAARNQPPLPPESQPGEDDSSNPRIHRQPHTRPETQTRPE